MRATPAEARTLLRDPIGGGPMVPPLPSLCIARMEAFAEKYRAALSRRDVAIRDFFDLGHAVEKLQLTPSNPALVDLVRRKLSVPGNDPVNVGPDRFQQLRAQLETRLRPVLRPPDYAAFDLDWAIRLVTDMAKAVAP